MWTRQLRILKLAGNRPQEIGRYSDIAVGHDEHIVLRCRGHVVQAPDLRVRVRRLAYEQQPRRDVRDTRPGASARPADGGIVLVAHGEQQFIRGIVLLEEGSEVRFETFIQAGQRLQNAERSRRAQRQMAAR